MPPNLVLAVKKIIGIDPADDSLVGDWPVTREQALRIARLISRDIDVENYTYMLEPYVIRERSAQYA